MTPAVLLIAIALIGTPVAYDLGTYVEASAEAEFAGEQLVSCVTPDGDRTSVFQVAQVDGSVVAWESGEGTSIVTIAPGQTATVTGDEVETAVVEGSNGPADVDDYEVASSEAVRFLGREAEEVVLERDGVTRVRLTIDQATEAIVRTRTFNEDDSLYCDRRFLTFETEGFELPDIARGTEDQPSAPIEDSPEGLPEAMSGFQLLDTYGIDDGTLSYFTDGFFSLGVVITERPLGMEDGAEVVAAASESGDYQRQFEAGTVTVAWEADGSNLAVIGDLPPDLLDDMLEQLPPPSDPGFLGRIWSHLFG